MSVVVAPMPTRWIWAGNLRPLQAETVKLACCPTCTLPTSASSTFTCSSIWVRSSAREKSTGVVMAATTVWPGSTLRVSTTPSTGERMVALAILVSSDFRVARAWVTAARALASLAWARSRVASAVSSSVLAGTLPPDSSATWRMRERLARASATVATAWATLASAAATAAWDLTTWSLSLEMSSWASNWPFFTCSFSCTSTDSRVPESSLPTSTDLVGARVPLAETVTTRGPLSTVSVRNWPRPFLPPERSRARASTAMAPAARKRLG